ncbi:hypothetical protein CPB84DRAFT_1772299 [Gymnopilus junonius]|uniref:Uncharacterized protein n=1 Tax=Gymnopilus junonius TaxID=109634 RepID=A0A9P5NSJ7_GYMJU|nr:hypothetical protein CPB84DRAFT_1772299 [Gymnopilus junonius]
MNSSQDLPTPNSSTHFKAEEQLPKQCSQPEQLPTSPKQSNPLAIHPNGSEGWLPTEDPQPNKPTSEKTPVGYELRDPGVALARRPSTGDNLARGSSSASRQSISVARSGSKRSVQSLPFINGPGTSGICATPEPGGEAHARLEQAQANLTSSQKSKIAKGEADNGKRLSKIIKDEAKVEKQTLAIAINELADLQKVQKDIVKNIAHVQTAHSKLLVQTKKSEAKYLVAKRKFEAAQTALVVEEDTIDTLRQKATDVMKQMQDKSAEVDSLRHTLAVDEREREVVLAQLQGKKKGIRA